MAKDKVTRWMRAFVGPYDLSGDARTFGTLMNSIGEVDNSGWNDEYHRFIGDDSRVQGVEAFQAILNDTASRSFATLSDLGESEISILFGGGAEPGVGDAAYMMPAIQVQTDSPFDAGLAVMNANFRPDTDQYQVDQYNPFGRVLSGATSRTVTYTGASVDWGTAPIATTTRGGWALLQILASSGGAWTFKVQDSPNDSAWGDLITFSADGSTIVAEVGKVAGNVDQWTRGLFTRTSGTVTAVLTFARNYGEVPP